MLTLILIEVNDCQELGCAAHGEEAHCAAQRRTQQAAPQPDKKTLEETVPDLCFVGLLRNGMKWRGQQAHS